MKIFQKKGPQKRLLFKLTLIIGLSSLILGSGLYIGLEYSNISKFAFEYSPDATTFKDPDLKVFAEIADGLDNRYSLYHHPLNQSAKVLFNNDSLSNNGSISYTNVSEYIFNENEALYTAIDFVGWVYKYLTAQHENNLLMRNEAFQMLMNLSTGLINLIAVPNGGLGSEYAGILARGVCPPDQQNIWPELFEADARNFNGSGPYSQWRYRAYTSNDEYAGYYLFLAMVTKYLHDVQEIYNPVSLIVDQLCIYMIRNNFLGIHGSGAMTGVDQKARMFGGGFYVSLLLKMGAIHYPEKYGRLYQQFIANEMYFLSASESGPQEVIANYYAFNFGMCICFSFLILEEPGSKIWEIFYKGYYQSIWYNTRYHRNAWSNAIFLMINFHAGISNPKTGENLTFIISDISDQLQRFTESHYPHLEYAISSEMPEEYSIVNPIKPFAEKFGLSTDFQKLIGFRTKDTFVNKPLTVEYLKFRPWYWSGNPYLWQPGDNENILSEERGSSFTVIYWMMRYMGYYNGGVE